jgi:hypothetical protein
METFVANSNRIFSNINYKFINKFQTDKQMRNSKGITLQNTLLFRFKYTENNTTKTNISCTINYKNKKDVHRTCYLRKEQNLSLNLYKFLSKQVYNNCNKINKKMIVAVDGTCSNDISHNVALNMGYYNVSNNLVLDLTHNGNENRNKEIKNLKEHINDNKQLYKNTIIVGDRAYFSYELMSFLKKNNIDFIIRCKGKNIKNTNNNRIVYSSDQYEKTIWSCHKKRKREKKVLLVNNDCTLLTSIMNKSDNELMEIYKSRWNIETYFKIIKKHFKIQHTKEKHESAIGINKILCCTSIITNIASTIKNNFETCNNKINTSLLLYYINNYLLEKIINGSLTVEDIYNAKYFALTVVNNDERHFPRISKTPFTKWYVKGYSNYSEINKIVDAIENNNIHLLDKNKKLQVQNIISIKK